MSLDPIEQRLRESAAADLHTRVMMELAKPWEIWAPPPAAGPLGRMRLALLAAAARHAPTARDTILPACDGCSTHDGLGWVSWVAYPCGELQAIAGQLRV